MDEKRIFTIMKKKKPILILLFSILLIGGLIGCTKPIELECENITINNTIETIKYINITREPCNLTSSKERELELIRRIKFLEGQQNKWIINETECMYNITEEKLQNCKDKIDMYKRDIEELEDELEDCEDEICEYNESWC